MSPLDRRAFLARSAALGGLAFIPRSVRGLAAASRDSLFAGHGAGTLRAYLGEGGYGPLYPAGPELALPKGFEYVRFGTVDDPMSDGNPTPIAHDGMAAFPTRDGKIRLLRNHEDAQGPRAGNIARQNPYDSGAGGGVVTLVVDPETRRLERDFVTLNGTAVNCAGGPTPWGSWLSCEETTLGPSQGWEKPHGYIFEVPVTAEGPVEPRPLTSLGRFVHEAVAIDPATGIVYQTEDRHFNPAANQPGSGFYRFLPTVPGDLGAGGQLQVLAIAGERNFETFHRQSVGSVLPVSWIDVSEMDLDEAETDPSAMFRRCLPAGAALFQRLEGCWFGEGSVFFHATSGGDAGLGQVWQYRPEPDNGYLTLLFESPGTELLDSPDNITVSPRGGIVICEDGGGEPYLRGLTPDGTIFDFARNTANGSEFAGACFSPDGHTLFVNVQGSRRRAPHMVRGYTMAVWGPWEIGAL